LEEERGTVEDGLRLEYAGQIEALKVENLGYMREFKKKMGRDDGRGGGQD
jgi:hypothetical protein